MENNPNPKEMTLEELEANLLTCDYRGKEFKRLCLEEIIRRAIKYCADESELRNWEPE